MISFGPIPSRRLGHSLGINNIPPKTCTFACVYCQVGQTSQMVLDRQAFYPPEQIVDDVSARVQRARQAGEPIDYLTFAPDGEPTLDVHLGREIDLLRHLGIKIAVITNSTLIWRPDVCADLMKADWVSVKVDAVQEDVWRQIDRPHGRLRLDTILCGLQEFARAYRGAMVSETMLVGEVNDGGEHIEALAAFLGALSPQVAYLGIPTRPPAENWVRPPDEERINRVYQTVSRHVAHVECLLGYEGNAFAFTGNVEQDILNISAVHPMRQEAVAALLERAGSDWQVVNQLVLGGQLIETVYGGNKYYLRRFPPKG